MSDSNARYESAFRGALLALDFERAQSSLRDYITWFGSQPRSVAELQSARALLGWGIQFATSARLEIARELMRLKSRLDAYYTWSARD